MEDCLTEEKVVTNFEQMWTYETDEKKGICIIAKDPMQIKFKFEACGRAFFDVLEIDAAIDELLKVPVSVEGIADQLKELFPSLSITASGRAFSHGWITTKIFSPFQFSKERKAK